MPTETPASSPAEKPRRGCLGCFATSALGCLAFLGGAVGAVVLLAPSLLGGPIQHWLVRGWDAAVVGRVRLEALDLAWTRPVRLRGLQLDDSEGGLVAAVDVTLPSLFSLLNDDVEVARRAELEVRALELVVESDGRTNLERLLAPTAEGESARFELGAFDARLGFEQRFPYELELTGGGLRVFAGDRGTSPLATVATLSGKLAGGHGEPAELVVSADLARAGQGSQGTFGLHGVLGDRRSFDGQYRGLPTQLLDLYLGADGALVAALGEAHEALWSVAPEEGNGAADVVEAQVVGTDGAHVELRGKARDGILDLQDGGACTGEVRLRGDWVAQLSRRLLPDDVDWHAAGPRAAWGVSSSNLRLDLGAGLAGAWSGATGALALASESDWELRDAGGGVLQHLARPQLALEVQPGGLRVLEVFVETEEGRAPVLRWRPGGDELTVTTRALPLDLVARALRAPLLASLVDDAGRGLEVSYEALAGGSARLELRGGERVLVRGVLDAGTLAAATSEDVVRLQLDLEREAPATLARSLVPWLERLQKPDDAEPALLEVRAFRLPIDGSLDGARAKLELDLGDVLVWPTPSFRGLFADDAFPTDGPARVDQGTLHLEFEREIVHYQSFDLIVADDYYDFRGDFDVRSLNLVLQGDLAAVRVAPDLARGAEATLVPVTISGRPDGLRMLLDLQAFRSATTQLEGLLKGVLDDDAR